MGKVIAINVSPVRGIEKNSIDRVEVIEGWGLEGDAHGGDWDRQVSILPVEAMDKVPAEKKEEVLGGGYTENFTLSGVSPSELAVGNMVLIGEAVIKIMHIGKEELKEHGRPYIVSREGRFGRVIKGGTVLVGDRVSVYPYNKESFFQCVQEGNVAMVKLFLDQGMDPDAKDNYSATALMLATRNEDEAMVRALLEKGADVNIKSDDGVTALMAAAFTEHAGIVEMLLAAGADVNIRSQSGLTALLLAREKNNYAVLRILEKYGAQFMTSPQ